MQNTMQLSYPVTLRCIAHDFSPVSDAVIHQSSGEYALSDSQKTDVLCAFLRDQNSNCSRLIVNDNSAARKSNPSKYHLYSPQFNGGYFQGTVGTVHGQFSYELSPEIRLDVSLELQIKSRMDKRRTYFLSTLLLSRSGLRLSNDTVPSSDDHIFDYLLVLRFRQQLRQAYLKGVFRAYRTFQKNDSRPRGMIDIPAHLRLNLGQDNGCIASRYRERSIRNNLNRLVVFCYGYLKQKHPLFVEENFDTNQDLLQLIKQLSSSVGVNKLKRAQAVAIAQKPIPHPYFIEYEALRKTCAMILRNEGVSLFDQTTSTHISGILFYLPGLWELYLKDVFLEQVIACSNDTLFLHDQYEVKLLEGAGTAYPDFVFSYLDTSESANDAEGSKREKYVNFAILDAKFKPGWIDVFFRKSLSFLWDDFDKCLRDKTVTGSFWSGVIYPVLKAEFPEPDPGENYFPEDRLRLSISSQNHIDKFYQFPVIIPNDVPDDGADTTEIEYQDWLNQFQQSVRRTCKSLLGILSRERDFHQRINAVLEQALASRSL